ncbi:MAG: hypothetical protein OZ921_01045 [Sorangiineae bacterium]|nr:hypothetical protein [Polyangiaceae bacterium]MEB2321070.1 hypothetical protein [Sorangiineae bacterium]
MTTTIVLAMALGGSGGYAYYRLIGCRSGVCPIGSNPVVSVIYGVVLGYLLAGGRV